MSGPIVRSGPSPEFSANWDRVFGKKKKKATASKSGSAKKKTKKPAKKKGKK